MTRPVATPANKAAVPWRAVGVAVDIVDPERRRGAVEGLESIVPQRRRTMLGAHVTLIEHMLEGQDTRAFPADRKMRTERRASDPGRRAFPEKML